MADRTAPLGLGDWFPTKYVWAYNRTGATLLKGQVVVCDILRAQAETTTFSGENGGQVETDVLSNVTTCTQANVDEGAPCLVCASVSVADNAIGKFVLEGRCEVAICDDDVSTTDIDKGDRIAILVSESAVYPQAWATSSGGTRTLGQALEDAAATSADTDRLVDASAHLRWCLWTAGYPCSGVSDT